MIGGVVGTAVASYSHRFCEDWSLASVALPYGTAGMLSMQLERPEQPGEPMAKPKEPAAETKAVESSHAEIELGERSTALALKHSNSIKGKHPVTAAGDRALGEESQLRQCRLRRPKAEESAIVHR